MAPPPKKVLKCVNCKIKPRAKKSLRCASCRRDTDEKYWASKAWKVFSEYTRRRGASFQDYKSCYTCVKSFHWKKLNAGHFSHRGNRGWQAIDFNDKHIQSQCVSCNKYNHGMSYEFGKHLSADYFIEWPDQIKLLRTQQPPLTVEELKEIYLKYGLLLKTL